MKSNRIKIIVILLLFVLLLVGLTLLVCFLVSKYCDVEFVESLKVGLIVDGIFAFISLAIAIIKKIAKALYETRDYTYKLEYRNKEIRLSFAYLIRIRVNNKYLLVKSGHDRDLYGPVGGVYHIEHIDYVYNKLKFSRDGTPGDSEDVRGSIIGKNVAKFIKWFDKKENRETSPNREFYEELIETGVISNDLFSNLNFKFICTRYRGIQYGSFYRKLELCRFDIFELVLSKEQETYIKTINKNKNIYLATRDEIESYGVHKDNDKRTIGDQTPYILEG